MPQFFSPEARAAAIKARRRRAELIEQQRGKPEVMVIRSPDDPRCFSWQLRMFGGLPIETTSDSYATAELARRAGRAALATRATGSLNSGEMIVEAVDRLRQSDPKPVLALGH